MNRLLIVAILMLSTTPLYAQGQPEIKLKEDARNAVSILGADRGKTWTYCKIVDLLGRQLGPADQENRKKRADREKDKKTTRARMRTINELQKRLGAEFVVLENILNDIDLKSADGREIALIIQSLNQTCPE
jgi:hypothetical protein